SGVSGLFRRIWRQRRIEPVLRAIASRHEGSDACPVTLLPELSCVELTDVMEWFRQHDIYSERIRLELAESLFRAGGREHSCRNRADIEDGLARIHSEFSERSGPAW